MGYQDLLFEFSLTTLIAILVRRIKNRYKNLNNKLLQISTKVEIKLDEVLKLMQMYRILSETVQIFNELFGYLFVLMFFHFGVETVSCLNFFYVYILIATTEMPLFHYILVANLCVIILVVVSKKNFFYNLQH